MLFSSPEKGQPFRGLKEFRVSGFVFWFRGFRVMSGLGFRD